MDTYIHQLMVHTSANDTYIGLLDNERVDKNPTGGLIYQAKRPTMHSNFLPSSIHSGICRQCDC